MRRTEQLQGLRMLKLRDILTMEGEELEPAGGGGDFGDERADLPPLGPALRGGRRGRPASTGGLAGGRAGRCRKLRPRGGAALPRALRGFTVKHFHEHLRRDHGFRWATPGPRPSCTAAGCRPRPGGAGRTGASGRGGRWWA